MILRFIAILLLLISCTKKETKVVEVPAKDDTTIEWPPPDGFPPTDKDQGFLGFDNIEQFALRNVQTFDAVDRPNTRWILLIDKFNEGASRDQMKIYKSAIEKSLNQMSVERTVGFTQAVDAAGAILRIDLDDFGLTAAKWDLIVAADPFPFWGLGSNDGVNFIQTQRGELISELTETDKPFILGNVFLNTAINEVYYDILEVPILLTDFYQDFLGIDLQQEFDDFNPGLFLAGIDESEISIQKTRLIIGYDDARFGSAYGTYDTFLNKNDVASNVFDFPFPVEARSFRTFNHDAQEFIFELENGCHGYALYDANGIRQNFAPTNIVFDVNAASFGLNPEIRNPISCTRCHSQGVIPVTDQVTEKVARDPDFNADDREKVNRYHGRIAGFSGLFNSDNDRYQRECLNAMEIPVSNTDPISQLSDTLRLEMDINQIASFLPLKVEEFRQRLEGSVRGKAEIGQLLTGGKISFEQWALTHPVIVVDLRLYQDPLGQ